MRQPDPLYHPPCFFREAGTRALDKAGKYGLPPLPRVDVCLHAGGDPESAALKQLRRTVTEHALVELAGQKKRRSVEPRLH